MVLQPTLLPVSVDQLNVLLLVRIVLNLPIPVHDDLLKLVRLQMERHRIPLELIVNAVVQIVQHRRDIIAMQMVIYAVNQ